MKQTYTSAATSMNATKLPKVYGKLPPLPHNSLLFDYGCGRYTDHIRAALPGVIYLPYDPYNQADEENCRSAYYLLNAAHIRMPVTVVCSNVLNVIDSDDTVRGIAGSIIWAVMKTGGTGYVTVYEGNRSGTGRQTGPDQYQRNQRLRDYLPFFQTDATLHYYGRTYRPAVTIERGMIIVRCEEVHT